MSKLKYFDGTNWKDVNGKIVGDTLPVGSIVGYDGQSIPAGWEEVSGTSNIKKVSQTAGLIGAVSNSSSNSQTDTYSCDFINTLVASKGKRLWTGSFTSGEITVTGLSNYSIICVKVENIYCFGSKNYGIGGCVEYGSYNIKHFAYRFDVSGDKLIINSTNKGGSNGSSQETVSEVWGLF